MMRFEHNRSCSLSSERASTFASESSVRSRSLERNSSHFVRSALYPYPPVSETYHRDHRRGKNGEKSRKNMKWRSYSSVDRRTNSASPCRSHDRHHSGRSRSSSRDRSDRHGKRRNRSRSRSESAHRSHEHHRRPTSSSSRHFDRNPHFSDLPLEWWEREEDCKLAKEAHTDKIDYLWPSREDLVLETTLAEDDTVLEPNMFPYATPEGIAHYTLWSKRDLSHHEIVHFVDGWLSKHHPQVRRWQYDDNSGERSILLFHVHVFIEMVPFCFRPRPGMEYFPPHIA